MASTRGSLESWLEEAQIKVHPALDIIRADEGLSIRANASVEPKTSVARIPKQAVLSQRTSSLGQDRLSQLPSSLSPPLRLAVCLLHEQLLGSTSRWKEYLDSLPTDVVPIAVLWPNEGEARRWARGTELAKELKDVQLDPSSLAALFDSVVLPFFLSSPTPPPTFAQFLHAYSIVSSRAFQVDSWHSLSLVPLADIFNHTDDHDVHLESEHWVCPECGALDACEHDEAEESDTTTSRQLVEDDSCEMVTVERISAGQEVFNTYGELSNAQLLAFYGFALEANKYDHITLTFDEVARLAPSSPPASTIAEEWTSLDKLLHSAVEERDQQNKEAEEDVFVVDGPPGRLYIDADARLSSSLWLLLVLLHVPLPSAPPNRLELLQKSRSLQIERLGGEETVADLDPLGDNALRVLAEAVRALCAARLAGQEDSHRTGGELLELATASTDTSLRQALELAASERILLECVSQAWSSSLYNSAE
ncbi:hypothetical protein BCR35DRAFT_287453 [Leucosporidium creatinivorum]|uniref:SET domain-containing protein n=1 Tax=Leucosporidium creatinivorum TaxID=106004 RepID=A0A1Y2G2E7_9BASI|nr:hypothetical protein BCR35DRAFT_287453 [Leucosporidium creatinivorum]